jgi:excinuclease ABC subunit A
MQKDNAPRCVAVRGARVHNLCNLDVDVPLYGVVAIAGVSGSGKSSLALGVLYAEGARRYMEGLSAYTRRRLTGPSRPDVDAVRHVPAALALRQRPGVPGIRSTFGTGTELLSSLRLLFSRLASHRCPNGHMLAPTLDVAAGRALVCPTCGAHFNPPAAEDLSFNAGGACRTCSGTGIVRTVDVSTLVPDESLSIDEGAVLPWRTLMWSLMTDVCREMGVRTDVPFSQLTQQEREIVFHGPAVKKHIFYRPKNGGQAGELDFTYYNAVHTVENALQKVRDEAGMKRVARFLREDACPDCGGTRLSEEARAPRVRGIGLDAACAMPLSALADWVRGVPETLPEPMRPMAQRICASFTAAADRLLELGLGYLSLDRAASTLSTGERQRMSLAHAVRSRTTGVLYVLDEPSIGLHPSNLAGLKRVMRDLVADGNSVVVVDHDMELLRVADYLIELGPGAGKNGGRIVAQGTLEEVLQNPQSVTAPFLTGARRVTLDRPADACDAGVICLETGALHTVRPLTAHFLRGKLNVVTGVSGSGKTTLVLESLVPALAAREAGRALPPHVKALETDGPCRVHLIDASPIGANVRSTVATYAGVHDELRRLFARTPDAKARALKAGDFSYNTGRLRCDACDGTGAVNLDVQFLPDVQIPCPACRGGRYGRDADAVSWTSPSGQTYTLPQLMRMDVESALAACADVPLVARRLRVLRDIGLGYLTLGEATPLLSGGEAQRLKLAAEMGRDQRGAVFVFDEPTIGLHPLDVQTLLDVFAALLQKGATLVVIEHDADVMRNADYILDMGPGGGCEGGRIVCCGTPAQVAACEESRTGAFLRTIL